jgi:putative tryptophan/tyrosine transport system substrate-binding protein
VINIKKEGGLRSFLVLLLFAFCTPSLVLAAERSVHIVLGDTGEAYAAVAQAFQQAFAGLASVKVWAQEGLSRADLEVMNTPDSLLVPVGMSASRYIGDNLAVNASASVLGLMVPRDAIADIPLWSKTRKSSFVYIDQPVKRSLELIQATLPKARRVGVLVSNENLIALRSLRAEAEEMGMSVQSRFVEPDATVSATMQLGLQLRRLLEEVDVLLLLPDPYVVNNATLNILLRTSYRQRVPVIGFSPGQVRAGAVACVFTSPKQIGQEGGRMARSWVQSGRLPAPSSTSAFSVQTNQNVARSLGISLASELEVQRKLGASSQADR